MHLGKSETAPDFEIVGVFDIERATQSEATKRFLKRMQSEYKAVNLASDLPRAFVLASGAYSDRVYLTSLSAEALKKRARTRSSANEKNLQKHEIKSEPK